MEIKPVFPSEMKKPAAHYSPAIVYNGTVYVSGQLPLDADGIAQLGSIEDQTRLCMKNLETILKASGSDLSHVLKVNVFLSDIANWAKFNETYASIMGQNRPARLVIPCGLLNRGCEIEIDCIAAVKN